MCRSIKTLREGTAILPGDEIVAAARQYVRKVSGFARPAPANEGIFEAAVEEIAHATAHLLEGLTIAGRPTTS